VRPGVYTVLSKPLARADAFKVCKEMGGLHPDDWSRPTGPPPNGGKLGAVLPTRTRQAYNVIETWFSINLRCFKGLRRECYARRMPAKHHHSRFES
jgi:hypothetical protein